MHKTSLATLSLDVKDAIMFPPALRLQVVRALDEHHKLRANTQRTPAIGCRLNGKQYWVSEWEFTG